MHLHPYCKKCGRHSRSWQVARFGAGWTLHWGTGKRVWSPVSCWLLFSGYSPINELKILSTTILVKTVKGWEGYGCAFFLDQSSLYLGLPAMCPSCQVQRKSPKAKYWGMCRIGQNQTHIQCIYSIFGREITKYAAIYGAYTRFWLTLECVPQDHALLLHTFAHLTCASQCK